MADKKTLCDALGLLVKIVSIDVTLSSPVKTSEAAVALTKSVEPVAKTLAPELIAHIEEQARSIHVPEYPTWIAELKTALNAAKYGEGRYLGVIEKVRGYVHSLANLRRLFLGSDEKSQPVFEALEVLENGDASDARDMLEKIEADSTCLEK